MNDDIGPDAESLAAVHGRPPRTVKVGLALGIGAVVILALAAAVNAALKDLEWDDGEWNDEW